MDCLDLLTIESIEYINCPKCGWFETAADGAMSPCEPPQSPVMRTEPELEPESMTETESTKPSSPPPDSADVKSPGGSSPPPGDEPINKEDDEEDEVNSTM